jgi:hypothetical protein
MIERFKGRIQYEASSSSTKVWKDGRSADTDWLKWALGRFLRQHSDSSTHRQHDERLFLKRHLQAGWIHTSSPGDSNVSHFL